MELSSDSKYVVYQESDQRNILTREIFANLMNEILDDLSYQLTLDLKYDLKEILFENLHQELYHELDTVIENELAEI